MKKYSAIIIDDEKNVREALWTASLLYSLHKFGKVAYMLFHLNYDNRLSILDRFKLIIYMPI
jgi:hypothetical protein